MKIPDGSSNQINQPPEPTEPEQEGAVFSLEDFLKQRLQTQSEEIENSKGQIQKRKIEVYQPWYKGGIKDKLTNKIEENNITEFDLIIPERSINESKNLLKILDLKKKILIDKNTTSTTPNESFVKGQIKKHDLNIREMNLKKEIAQNDIYDESYTSRFSSYINKFENLEKVDDEITQIQNYIKEMEELLTNARPMIKETELIIEEAHVEPIQQDDLEKIKSKDIETLYNNFNESFNLFTQNNSKDPFIDWLKTYSDWRDTEAIKPEEFEKDFSIGNLCRLFFDPTEDHLSLGNRGREMILTEIFQSKGADYFSVNGEYVSPTRKEGNITYMGYPHIGCDDEESAKSYIQNRLAEEIKNSVRPKSIFIPMVINGPEGGHAVFVVVEPKGIDEKGLPKADICIVNSQGNDAEKWGYLSMENACLEGAREVYSSDQTRLGRNNTNMITDDYSCTIDSLRMMEPLLNHESLFDSVVTNSFYQNNKADVKSYRESVEDYKVDIWNYMVNTLRKNDKINEENTIGLIQQRPTH